MVPRLVFWPIPCNFVLAQYKRLVYEYIIYTQNDNKPCARLSVFLSQKYNVLDMARHTLLRVMNSIVAGWILIVPGFYCFKSFFFVS